MCQILRIQQPKDVLPLGLLILGLSTTGLAQNESSQSSKRSLREAFPTERPEALADESVSPHSSDGTRLNVQLTDRIATPSQITSFEKDIAPLLASKCHACHGEESQESMLDLRTVSEMLRGGENGPAIVRGNPQASLLFDLVSSGQMPPDKEDRLTAAERNVLERWILAGAPAEESIVSLPSRSTITKEDRDFWAFRSPLKIEEPIVRNKHRVRNSIDSFLLAKLEEKGLGYSDEADRSVMIRRAYFDLLGVPPEPDAVRAFLMDDRPDAYEWLIDALLKSPLYGERWGRHWLDAVGYVDGKLDNDLGTMYPSQGIWRYRDYVIESFNSDKPFDQFLIEQIAGDEMVDWRKMPRFDKRTLELLTATGFLRNVDDHTDFPQYGIEKRYEVVNETLDMFSTSIFGLTMECCRCHNHKYDPLPQRDYYRLMACFEPAFNVHEWKPPKERFLADVSLQEQAEIDQRNKELDQKVAELSKSELAIREKVRLRVRELHFAALPESIRDDVRQAIELKPEQRSEIQKYLVEKLSANLKVAESDIDAALTDSEKQSLQASAEERAGLLTQKKSYDKIQALWDVGKPPISHVHRRGNVHARGALVQAGFPEILQTESSSVASRDADALGETSGRRLALAKWLTQSSHPLTARVFVNRVWHHHFGRGIVETLGNFGRSGSAPTHPELLDWLAVDFMEHGWSIKRLHRQIMLSTAYRQTSRRSVPSATGLSQSAQDPVHAGPHAADPENRLLWRMNLRRIEAEIVRDSLLSVSGSLDRTAGGPPVEISNPANGLSEAKSSPTPTSQNRRSVYLFARRVYPLKFMEIFDAPIMPVNCTQRINSATVLQSLALLNSEFMFEQADRLANRIARTAGTDLEQRIRSGFQLVFSREPTDREIVMSVSFLKEQQNNLKPVEPLEEKAAHKSLADFCHMLLSSNEFLYIE